MTIAVIGHGRSPEGKGWGPLIDQCNIVVRMWDCEWQAPEDYGVKYDYGMFVLTPKGLRMFVENRVKEPTQAYLAYMGKPVPAEAIKDIQHNTEFVDTRKWVQLAEAQGGRGLNPDKTLTLTRGTAAACWACEHSPNGTVFLVGFDNVKKGINQTIQESFSPAYWDLYMSRFKPNVEKVYPVGGAKTATHDMSVEASLIKHVADSCGVTLHYAEDFWDYRDTAAASVRRATVRSTPRRRTKK